MASKRKLNRAEKRRVKQGKLPRYQQKNEVYEGEHYQATLFEFHPKTESQHDLMQCIKEFPITFAIGAFGTGKTYCAISTLVKLWGTRNYDKIVLARSNVPTGPSLGSFPGEPEDKLAHWLAPMLGVLKKAFGASKVEYMLAKGQIILQPIETIRGQSFENALVMVDEVQNLDLETLMTITSRTGEGSRMVLAGDPKQSDVNRGKDLLKFTKAVERNEMPIPVIAFGIDDIVRSGIAKDLAVMFHNEGW